MTVKDEIVEALRSGWPWAEIRANWRSKSQLYEALRMYFLEAEEVLAEKFAQLVQVEEQLKVGKMAVAEQAEKMKELTSRTEFLSVGSSEKQGVLEEIEGRLASLWAKGFSVERLEKIVGLECESGDTLLLQMAAFKDLQGLKKAVASRKREKRRLEKLIKKLGKQTDEIKEEKASETNRLDELIARSIAYEEAVSTTLSLFKAGYSTEDFHALDEGLKIFGIAGDPHLSISRLVEGLGKMKTLYNLNLANIRETKKWDILRRETAAARGELHGLKQLLNEIKEVEKAAIGAINETSKRAEEKVEAHSEQFTNDLSGLVRELEISTKNLAQAVANEFNEWSETYQYYEKMKEPILYGQAFFAMLESDEYLKKIPPSVIVNISERLLLWCKTNIQEVSVNPSLNICQKDFAFNRFLPYRFLVLIEFVVESLKKLLQEEK